MNEIGSSKATRVNVFVNSLILLFSFSIRCGAHDQSNDEPNTFGIREFSVALP